MQSLKLFFTYVALFFGIIRISYSQANTFSFHHDTMAQKVDVLVDGDLFTSYRYDPGQEKPFLYPIHTTGGTAVTRGFPMDPRPGERYDHPHHIGFWMNYGDVNGLDFWNNSYRVSEEKKARYGWIRHRSIHKMETNEGSAWLGVEADWEDHNGKKLLNEETLFTFSQEEDLRIIQRRTKLTAGEDSVYFNDNKEGMIAIRVRRELEHPENKPARLLDQDSKPREERIIDNKGVTGSYLTSEGKIGKDAWGKRAKWVALNGKIDGKHISLVLIDHPDNIGYPTYWHARTYGLFSANPLGQAVFSKGKEVLNFSLGPKESVVFTYTFLIHAGDSFLSRSAIETQPGIGAK